MSKVIPFPKSGIEGVLNDVTPTTMFLRAANRRSKPGNHKVS
jgi:hypothetical protein